MALIDVHAHLYDAPDSGVRMIEEAGRLDIAKLWLSAWGEKYGQQTNEDVESLAARHPGRIVPVAAVWLGRLKAGEIDGYARRGFRVVKFINPPAPYDAEEFFPVYERCAQNDLVLHFHAGIVARMPNDVRDRIRCDHMRPVFLDSIARRLPDARIVMAHLGGPWYEEAFMTARINSNIHLDFSSGSGWHVKGFDGQTLRRKLWWPNAPRQWLFGTDVPTERMEWMRDEYVRLLDETGYSPDERALALRGNAERLIPSK